MLGCIWTKIGIVGLALLLSLVPVIPPHEASAGGICEQEDGWVCIANETDLQNMSNNRNGKYKLADNINLMAAWTPIGPNISTPFKGEFDGNGYTISNMQINSTASGLGFFGVTEEATIRNMRLIDVDINASGGSDNVAGIVGYARNTTIENSSVTGTIQAVSDDSDSKSIGGAVGYSESSTIINSSFYGSVEGNEDVGGLIGYGMSPNDYSAIVINSYAIGNVSGETNVGGFAGRLVASQIENSFAAVDVRKIGGESSSGFVAFNEYNSSAFSNNFWNNDLTPSAGSGADGKTTFQMKRAANYDLWPPSDAWKMVENASYPVHAELFDEISLNSLAVKDVTGTRDDEIEIDYEESNGYYEIPVAYDVASIELNFNHLTTSDITFATKSSASGSEMLDNHYPEYTSSPAGWSTTAPATVNGASSTSDSTVTIPLQDTLTFVQIVVKAQGGGPESVYKLTIARDEGSSTYPHRISTAGQLASIGDGGYGLDDHYILTDDIDLSEYDNWTPIGVFTGNFNGNNHVIDHLTITSGDQIGLFRQISGTVSHLQLRGVNISGHNLVGGLAGINSGTVTHSSVVGEVTGNDQVGGLVGMDDGGTIEHSYAAGKVTGSSQIGGLAGQLTALSTVNESYAAVEVTPVNSGTDIGGLIGSHEDGATISRSYWDMSLFETSLDGAGLDTTDMKRSSSFLGWDFATDWGIIENTTYPMHRVGYAQVLLNDLRIDGNSLDGFSGDQGSYSLMKGNGSPVTITPERANPNSVVAINGNNDVSQAISLNEGNNEIEIIVVSANEAWTGLYKLHILVDTLDPDISTPLSPPDATSGNVEVGVEVDGTGSDVAVVKWAEGVRDSSYFGADGTAIVGPTYGFTVGTNGTYTVYARDQAGNDTVQTVTVSNIITDPPTITPTYNLDPTNGTVEVSVTTVVYGEIEGNSIDILRWASGIQDKTYFASNGIDVAGGSFDAIANGNYTLYVRDTAGNEAVRTVTISNIVTEQPSIILTYLSTLTRESVAVSVTTVVYGEDEGNTIEVLRWAPGLLDAADFAGSAGTNITGGQFTVTENGIVTVYARDRAGFETVERLDVNWIVKQPPAITHDYESAAAGLTSIDITVATIVDGSVVGNVLDVLKWEKGSYTITDFAGGTLGQDITSSSTFAVTSNGNYTLYARDIVGNETALTFTVKKIFVPSFSDSIGTSSDSQCQAEHCISLAAGEAKQFEVEGLTLKIPANATNTSMTVMLKNITSHFLSEERLLSLVYEITKSVEGRFLKPIMLEFRFDPVALGANSRPAVFYYDEEEKVWIKLDNTKVTGDNTVQGETDHFTKFAVLAIEKAAAAADPDEEQPVVSFSDINRHWAKSFIERAVLAGFASGYTDGTFQPNRAITRAEFTVMLAKALKLVSDEEITFRDAAAIPAWARQGVAAAVASGIISGYDDGTFRPQNAMIRSEMAVMAARAAGLQALKGAEAPFVDNAEIPSWAKPYVAVVYDAGLIVGKNGNRFAAQDSLTRAEAVIILLGVLNHMSE